LRAWIEAAGCASEAEVRQADALHLPAVDPPVDLVFLDPPFPVWEGDEREDLLRRALAHLVPEGLLVLKVPRWLRFPEESDRRLLRRKEVGDAAYAVFLRL
jgi:16S rRNA G966 N2-methylase RsmD